MRFVALFLSIALLAGCGFSSKWVKPMEQGDYASLEKNIAEGADVMERDSAGITPLHHAAQIGDVKAIRILVDAGADIYAYRTINPLAPTPFSLAVQNDQVDAAKLLIDLGAAKTENIKVSEYIQRAFIDPGYFTKEQVVAPADYRIAYASLFLSQESIDARIEILNYLFSKGFKPTYWGEGLHNLYGAMPLEMLKIYLEAGGDELLNRQNREGNTLLFDQTHSENIKLSIKYGADISIKNNDGNTAIHNAIKKLGHVTDNEAFSLKDVWLKPYLDAGLSPNIKNARGQTALEYAYQVGQSLVIADLQDYEQKYALREKVDKEFKTCENSKALEAKANCYQAFAAQYSDHKKASVAQKRYESLNKKRLVVLEKKKKQQRLVRIKRQACKLKNQDWEYLSKACKNGYAHGSGTAINEEKNLKFVGEFKAGLRVQGEIFAYGNLMYDGPLKNDRPHGKGICMHEGEPEDCNYYKGKRTDVLYKQRIEFAKQRELLASTEKRINDSLKETESNIDKKLANIQTGSGNVSQGTSATDMVTEALKKKAADKAADFLFDQLF